MVPFYMDAHILLIKFSIFETFKPQNLLKISKIDRMKRNFFICPDEFFIIRVSNNPKIPKSPKKPLFKNDS